MELRKGFGFVSIAILLCTTISIFTAEPREVVSKAMEIWVSLSFFAAAAYSFASLLVFIEMVFRGEKARGWIFPYAISLFSWLLMVIANLMVASLIGHTETYSPIILNLLRFWFFIIAPIGILLDWKTKIETPAAS